MFEIASTQLVALAAAALARRDLAQVETFCTQALARDPHNANALHLLGLARGFAGRFDEALAFVDQSLAMEPGNATFHANRGNILSQLGRRHETAAALRQSLALVESQGKVHFDLGQVIMRDDPEEARRHMQRALELAPNDANIHSGYLLFLNYLPDSTLPGLDAAARRWAGAFADPLLAATSPHPNTHDPHRRLNVGYVSTDFRLHPSAHFIKPLLEHHDRAGFEIFCYAHVQHPDECTQGFRAMNVRWRDITRLPDDALAEQIRADRIDILVDLNLHTHNHRLLAFARRVAPVQVSWLGYPGTTGLKAIDYRLTDRHLDPDDITAASAETPLRLPHSFWCYDPLHATPDVGELPAASRGHITFGCFNDPMKLSAGTLALWGRLLENLPRSRLVLHASGMRERTIFERLNARLRQPLDPARCTLAGSAPFHAYMERHNQVDIALDPFPAAGGATTFHALWMGLPVVTLAGATQVGRGGVSILSNLGHPEWIARDEESYLDIARRLAGNLDALANIRRTLRESLRRSPLMDAPRFARDVEALYRDVWRRWCTN